MFINFHFKNIKSIERLNEIIGVTYETIYNKNMCYIYTHFMNILYRIHDHKMNTSIEFILIAGTFDSKLIRKTTLSMLRMNLDQV